MPPKEKIPSAVRNAVWNTYVGTDKKMGKCFCCGLEPITCANFQCGHVMSEKEGGKVNIDNLRPICALCNTSMGTKDMRQFMDCYGFKGAEGSKTTESMTKKLITKISSLFITEEQKNEFSDLSIDELSYICEVYKLQATERTASSLIKIILASKVSYTDYLTTELIKLKKEQLKTICLEKGVKTSGNKKDLISRLIDLKIKIEIVKYKKIDKGFIVL